jgi:hypothetical protein
MQVKCCRELLLGHDYWGVTLVVEVSTCNGRSRLLCARVLFASARFARMKLGHALCVEKRNEPF